MSHYQLNVRGLLCPLPVIKVQGKVKELMPGDTLEIICTDPGALQDVPAWCRIHGHEVITTQQQQLDIVLTIRVR